MTRRTDESLAIIAAELRRLNELIALGIATATLTTAFSEKDFKSIDAEIKMIMED